MNVHSGAVIPTSCVAGGANKELNGAQTALHIRRRLSCIIYLPEADWLAAEPAADRGGTMEVS